MDTETRKQYNKTYYDKNKKAIQEKIKEKVVCDICKANVSKAHYYTQHKRSKKCMKVKNKQEEEKKEKLKYLTKEDIVMLKSVIEKLDFNDMNNLIQE